MWNARLDEAQARIKIAERNINNLRYADNTTLMAGSKKELKSLLMKLKEENENAGLKLTFRKLSQGHPVPSLQFFGLFGSLSSKVFVRIKWVYLCERTL